MNGSAMRSMLRHALAGSRDLPAHADADLVHRFATTGDEAAFAILVARHGAMVWGVCRQMLPDDADAEDAFQATFLTLLRSAASLNGHGSLAGWLHRVAYRVAIEAQRSAARRRRRERVAAVGEATCAIADSAWDRMLGAVHEEVNRLPDALRVPFVLCCLEGRRVTEAAAVLGWKLGTVSGRLTRAKQRVLDCLARRGLPTAAVVGSLGLAAATSSAAVPLALIDRTLALHASAGTIAPAVLHLTLGVTNMKLTRTIMIGVVLVMMGLLATGVGPALVSWATAQSDPKALAAVKPAQPAGKLGKWEYTYVEVPRPVSEISFESACRKMEPDGWEYSGTQEMTLDRNARAGGTPKSGPQLVLVFKRLARTETAKSDDLSRTHAAQLQLAETFARIEALRRQLNREAEQKEAAEKERERALYLEKLALATKEQSAVDAATHELLAQKDAAVLAARLEAVKLEAAQRELADQLKKSPQGVAPKKDSSKLPAVNQAAETQPPATNSPARPITIIPLGEGSAEKMAKMLTDLFGNQGTFQADERSNSLVIRTDGATLDEVHQLIKRLELQAEDKKRRDMEMKARDRAELERRYAVPK